MPFRHTLGRFGRKWQWFCPWSNFLSIHDVFYLARAIYHTVQKLFEICVLLRKGQQCRLHIWIKKQCAKSKSDPFVNIFAVGLCLLLEVTSSAVFSNILHHTEMANPVKLLRAVSLMTGLGPRGWKPTKGKPLGTYQIRDTWKTEAFQHEKSREITWEEINQVVSVA